MSQYIENNLAPDEVVISKIHKTKRYFILPISFAVIFVVLCTVLTCVYGPYKTIEGLYADQIVNPIMDEYDQEDDEGKALILETYTEFYQKQVTSRSQLRKELRKSAIKIYNGMNPEARKAISDFYEERFKGGIYSLASFLFAIIFVDVLYQAVFKYRCSELVLTNQRVFGKYGILKFHILRAQYIDIPINKVNQAAIIEGVFGKLCKYNNFKVTSIDDVGRRQSRKKERREIFVGIENAAEFRTAVLREINEKKHE